MCETDGKNAKYHLILHLFLGLWCSLRMSGSGKYSNRLGTWNCIFRYTQNLLKRRIFKANSTRFFFKFCPNFCMYLHIVTIRWFYPRHPIVYQDFGYMIHIWSIINVVGMFGYHKTKTLYVSVDSSHNLVFYAQYYVVHSVSWHREVPKSFNSFSSLTYQGTYLW